MLKIKIIFFFFLFPFLVPGQELVKDITNNKSVDNAALDSTYKKFSYDTLVLKNLLNESIHHKNPTAEIFFLNKLGIFYRDKSYYSKSFDYHENALKIAEKEKNVEQIIISNNLLGVVYRRKDEIIPAIEYHQKALELAESIKNPNETILRNIAISSNSLGNVYLTMNQLNDAMQYFERSLQIEKKIKNNLGLAINYQNIGGVYEKKNDLEKALANYRQSLFYNNKINSELGRLICNNSIGSIYLKQNKVDLARKHILPIIRQAEHFQDDFYTSMAYVNTGWLYFLEKNANAENTIKKGLSIAEEKGFITTKIEAYELLSKLYESENKPDSALLFYKKFATGKELLNSENTFKSINELKNKYTLEKRKNEINALKLEQDKMMIKLNTNKVLFSVIMIMIVLSGLVYYFYTRQKTFRQEKKMLLMEQDLLNLQMNPHFIFNALNSIKAFIIKNDTQNSVYYLNKFSKIFRNILTGIHQKETNLKQELENVDNYISIENMRYGGTINYHLKIEESVEPEKIRIPSFLLQVFVENAIWHGLALKEGEKKLQITIYKTEKNKIFIEINDNGIGRKKSQELSDKNLNKKESLGLKISHRRLENFYAKEYSLKIIDLKDHTDKPTGTLIQLKIPDCV